MQIGMQSFRAPANIWHAYTHTFAQQQPTCIQGALSLLRTFRLYLAVVFCNNSNSNTLEHKSLNIDSEHQTKHQYEHHPVLSSIRTPIRTPHRSRTPIRTPNPSRTAIRTPNPGTYPNTPGSCSRTTRPHINLCARVNLCISLAAIDPPLGPLLAPPLQRPQHSLGHTEAPLFGWIRPRHVMHTCST